MKHIISIFLLLGSLSAQSIAVSLAPYLNIVQEIAGPKIEVHLVVPQGASAHSFDVTPKQIQKLQEDSIWFIVGEPFESRAIKSLNKDHPRIVDLRSGLTLQEELSPCGHDHGSFDPHIWMNPEMMMIQIGTIRDALTDQFPTDSSDIYQRAENVMNKLNKLQAGVSAALSGQTGTIIVSHPAYGYLLSRYGIRQYALEFEGKEPSAKQLSQALDLIREVHATTLFTQKQYSQKAAQRIAEILKLKTVELDPYSSDYFTSIQHIAQAFGQELKEAGS